MRELRLDEVLDQGWKERIVARNTPLMGSIEVSLACNVRCVHCYVSYNVERDQRELSTREIEDLVDRIAEAGCLWLLFTGGEPFLRPDFPGIFEHAKRRGLLVTIFTNGTLLDEERVAWLRRFPPYRIEISIYGHTRETYERVTRRPGSWERCRRGIELVLAAGLALRLKTVLLEENRHELEAMRGWARELGVPFAFDAQVNGRVDGDRAPCSRRVEPERVVELEAADQVVAAGWKKLRERTAAGPARARDEGRLFHCGAGRNNFWVDPYGRLQLCALTRRHTYDLRRGDFEEGYFRHLQSLRERPSSPAYQCPRCDLLSICGQCPGMAEIEHGDPERRVEYLCRLAHLRVARFGLSHARCGCDQCPDAREG